MGKNKSAREALEAIYGKGCMFKRARIAERIEAMGGIKTYKRFLQEKRYTLKEIRRYESILTYHHLEHRQDGGKATAENGAEINSLAHCYIHTLPREDEETINNMLRDFKNSIECSVEFVDEINLPFTVVSTVFKPDELTKKKEKYNRAKEKREWQKQASEEITR